MSRPFFTPRVNIIGCLVIDTSCLLSCFSLIFLRHLVVDAFVGFKSRRLGQVPGTAGVSGGGRGLWVLIRNYVRIRGFVKAEVYQKSVR